MKKLLLIGVFVIPMVVWGSGELSPQEAERNWRYDVEDIADCLALDAGAVLNWQERDILVRNLTYWVSKISTNVSLHHAAWAEALSRLTLGEQFEAEKIPADLLAKFPELWRAVALMDGFYTHKGWSDALSDKGVWDAEKKNPALEAVLTNTSLTITEREAQLRSDLGKSLSGEALNATMATLLLGAEVRREGADLLGAVRTLLEKEQNYRSVARWLSLAPEVATDSAEVRYALDSFEKRPELYRASEPMKDALLRLIGLKGKETPILDALEEGVVERSINRAAGEQSPDDDSGDDVTSVHDDRFYSLLMATRVKSKYHQLSGAEQRIEFLMKPRKGYEYFEPALFLAASHYPEEVMWRTLNRITPDNPRGKWVDRFCREMAKGVRKQHPKYEMIYDRLTMLTRGTKDSLLKGVFFSVMANFEDLDDFVPVMSETVDSIGDKSAAIYLIRSQAQDRLRKSLEKPENAPYRSKMERALELTKMDQEKLRLQIVAEREKEKAVPARP